MDLTLDSSSHKKAQSNKLAVFSSIENRSDLLEGRKSNINDEMNKNIRPQNTNNMETKRYSLPQNVKDSFYAIHHIQRSIKENEINEENKKTKRKRVTTPPPTTPITQMTTSSNNRKKSRQTKIRKSSNVVEPSLYQTCINIWPEETEKSLGDFSHDNIKSLSNLLKVRLCQAKFKMMAKLDQDNELFTFLAEEYVPPKPKSPIKIRISGKQNKSTLPIVGNGRNLFKRHQDTQHQQQGEEQQLEQQQQEQSEEQVEQVVGSPQRIKNKERKKRTPRSKKTTPKRKSAAADVTPIIQSDGSSVYVCEPCNKKYKNRNGLAYHLERCKYVKSSQNSTKEDIQCICKNTEEHGTMVQCDKCRIWLHSECIGLTEDNLDDVFYCTNCKEQKDLLQCLLDTQQNSSDEQSSQLLLLSQQEDEYDDLEDEDEDEEDNNSNTSDIQNTLNNQLHVWDDFSFASIDNNTNYNDEEPFSNYDNDVPSSSWTMNDLNIFSQPPSLLFSDATALSSTLDEDSSNANITGTPLTVLEENETTTPINTNTPVHTNTTGDGLWFQFANFDDDYQCET